MAKTKAQIQAEYAKRSGYAANKKYEETHKNMFKMQSVRFRTDEIDKIDKFCQENDIKRNRLIRKATMEYIGQPIVDE